MAETIGDRAKALFAEAQEKISKSYDQIMREHAAAGKLQSGATIIRFFEAHEGTTSEALERVFESIGRRVEGRGMRWQRMVDNVRRELDEHLATAGKSLREKAAKAFPAFRHAELEPRLAEIRGRLYRQINDYQEGWTGAPGRPWTERHKLIYAILLLICGAIISQASAALFKLVDQ